MVHFHTMVMAELLDITSMAELQSMMIDIMAINQIYSIPLNLFLKMVLLLFLIAIESIDILMSCSFYL